MTVSHCGKNNCMKDEAPKCVPSERCLRGQEAETNKLHIVQNAINLLQTVHIAKNASQIQHLALKWISRPILMHLRMGLRPGAPEEWASPSKPYWMSVMFGWPLTLYCVLECEFVRLSVFQFTSLMSFQNQFRYLYSTVFQWLMCSWHTFSPLPHIPRELDDTFVYQNTMSTVMFQITKRVGQRIRRDNNKTLLICNKITLIHSTHQQNDDLPHKGTLRGRWPPEIYCQ